MNNYYISNDDVACKPIFTTLELDHDSWPIVITAPSTGLKAPKYDWKNHAWVENAAESQGQRIAELEADHETATKAIKQLQQDHAQVVQSNQNLETKMSGVQQLVVQGNANTAKMMSMMNELLNKDKQDGAASTGNTATTDKPAATTDKPAVNAEGSAN